MSDAIKAGYPGANPTPSETSPRVWPAVFIVALVWGLTVLPARLFPDSMMIPFQAMFFGTMGGTALFVIWWIFGSRVRWGDVFLGLLAVGAGLVGVLLLGDVSMNFFTLLFFLAPILMSAFVAWLALTPFLSWSVRRAGLVIVILAVCGGFASFRMEGTDGNFKATFQPRWRKSQEDAFLAEFKSRKGEDAKPATPVLVATAADWPEFRGVARESSRPGVLIETDWEKNPPKLLWKHRVGPGWSSFAAVGDRLFTQEQRGPEEVVVCYDAKTGKELWSHADQARFTEAIAGVGPRATPTFHEGKIYSQGAAGALNCLDAETGKAIWTRDVGKDSGSKLPIWGFSASPLIVNGIVTVYGGAKDKAVLAYDAKSGEPLWQAGDGDASYCSTQRSVIDGVEQLLIATNVGVFGIEPKTGKELWRHEWPLQGMARVAQPQVIGSDVLLGTSFDYGTRRFNVSHQGDTWNTKEVWTTRAFKPYYNDFVVHNDHIYGFDGPFFTCINLKDGKRVWRERGYGNGQVLLLPDQGLLVILSEAGEVALVEASPAGHKELAKIEAIEGKTWNHPVIAGNRLFVRNGQEAAGFELTPKVSMGK